MKKRENLSFMNNQSNDSKDISSSEAENMSEQPILSSAVSNTNNEGDDVPSMESAQGISAHETDRTYGTSRYTRRSYSFGFTKRDHARRPSYGPSTAYDLINKKREPVKIDISKIKVGVFVTHEKFGTGQVKEIKKSVVIVTFNGSEKKFQFPKAFEQGFLKIAE